MSSRDPSNPPQSSTPTVEALIRELLPEGEPRLAYEREIARGGIGAIGIAMDQALHRHVAMKTLHSRTYAEPILVRGFVREAQITGQLSHPNIVPVHDFGVDPSGQLFFTMKLVEGKSLSRILAQSRQTTQDLSYGYERLLNAVEIMIKVCDALGFAHSRGVLHCDLKAENIMVGDYGEVYLMDWGGAQLLTPGPLTDTTRWVKGIIDELPGESTEGLVFGTPAYMAPEQAYGKRSQMDERTDVFSIGAILYEILCGRAPFRAGSNLEALRLAQRSQVPALDDLIDRAVVPKELVRIAMKAMHREPAQRYPTVEAMKLDLLRLVRGGSSFPTIRYPAGARIITEGEVGDAAYIIVSGRVEAFREVDGELRSLRVMAAGEVFGEMAIFASSPRTASVRALEECSLVVVTSDVIHHEMDTMKPWMGAFIRALATRFAAAERARERKAELAAPRSPFEAPPAPTPAPTPAKKAAAVVTSTSATPMPSQAPSQASSRPSRLDTDPSLTTGESVVVDLENAFDNATNQSTDLSANREGREVTILTDVLGDEAEVDVDF